MDKKELFLPLFGRVINSLANSYNVLNIYGEKSKNVDDEIGNCSKK